MAAKGQMYALFYNILYKQLEHLHILVCAHGGPGSQSPADTKGWLQLSFWDPKGIHGFSTVRSVSLIPALFKDQLYKYLLSLQWQYAINILGEGKERLYFALTLKNEKKVFLNLESGKCSISNAETPSDFIRKAEEHNLEHPLWDYCFQDILSSPHPSKPTTRNTKSLNIAPSFFHYQGITHTHTNTQF